MALPPGAVTAETLITLKVSFGDVVRKVKLPLRDLSANILPDKLRNALNIPTGLPVRFQRYSDSAGGYIELDKSNVSVYKALVRAAKAKGKLRIIAVVAQKKDTITEETAPTLCPAAPIMAQAVPVPADCTKPRVGSGIFEYRANHGSQQTLVNEEAPLPQPFTTVDPAPVTNLAFRTRETATCQAFPSAAWSVYCNTCDAAMVDVHYHCSICDGGDYDLCENCVSSGELCPGEGHWLIKRFIKDGKVVTSVTERVTRTLEVPEAKSMPGGFADDVPVAHEPEPTATRTCNNCVIVLAEDKFITCVDCEDFDLCVPCHMNNEHGHSAKHTFHKATASTMLSPVAVSLLQAGRNVPHNAICDGCNKKIFGIRHKCLNCPDWDYCNTCHADAGTKHPHHRFAPIYEPLTEPRYNTTRHYGIYCDGPLCNSRGHQTYITGDRYKCAVCPDTDFCSACEAAPVNHHNRTHPLIKFRTPVRNVSISTTNEDLQGKVHSMGDVLQERSPCPPSMAAAAIQTIAEIPPTEERPRAHAVQPKDGDALFSPLPMTAIPATAVKPKVAPTALLSATFVKDSIPDGTVVLPGTTFTQIWTLRNEGPYAWPAGCSVRYVGGDNMLNVDIHRPAPVSDIARAQESSVVAREVQVGEEVAFRVTLRAPMREGKSISYWRLKSADGAAFGHRLWCDIEVRQSAIQDSSTEKVIAPPAEPVLYPFTNQRAVSETHQSRVMAMHETQLRLLHQQRMLRDAQKRVASMPVTSSIGMPSIDNRYAPAKRAQSTEPADMAALVEAEKLRREAAKARLEAIKAKIMRYRAENHKMQPRSSPPPPFDLSMVSSPSHNMDAPTFESKEVDSAPLRPEEGVPASSEEQQAELGAESTSSSQMIFPKLEKESPASSIMYSAKPAFVQAETGEVEQTAAISAPPSEQELCLASPIEEDFDDLEVVSAGIDSHDDDVSDDDDGFLTDEEYDILDASDRETVASPEDLA